MKNKYRSIIGAVVVTGAFALPIGALFTGMLQTQHRYVSTITARHTSDGSTSVRRTYGTYQTGWKLEALRGGLVLVDTQLIRLNQIGKTPDRIQAPSLKNKVWRLL